MDDSYKTPITDLYGSYWQNKTVQSLVDEINKMHENIYYSGQQFNTNWQGYKLLKYPGDLWNLQEIIYKCQPDIIIETGTAMGGSALFLANMLDLNNKEAKVLSIDIDREPGLPAHKRIVYFIGSSTDKRIVAAVKKQIPAGAKVMVILDSDHHEKHVTKELSIYAPLVSLGQYLVVEDSNICGNPIKLINFADRTGGPMASIKKFMKNNEKFIHDTSVEHKHMITFHPKGWLKRVQ